MKCVSTFKTCKVEANLVNITFSGNFYMMYWADSRQGLLEEKYCFTSGPPSWVDTTGQLFTLLLLYSLFLQYWDTEGLLRNIPEDASVL